MRYLVLVFIALGIAFSASGAMAKEDKYLQALNNQLSFREASSYSQYIEQRDIGLGLEPIGKDEVKRLFGKGTGKYRQFDVAITNNSKFRIYINQIQIKRTDNQPYPKIDLSDIHDAIDPGGRGNKDDMRDAALRNNLINKAMPHTILAPGETIQGILFVRSKYLDEGANLFLQIQNMKRVAFLDFNIPLN